MLLNNTLSLVQLHLYQMLLKNTLSLVKLHHLTSKKQIQKERMIPTLEVFETIDGVESFKEGASGAEESREVYGQNSFSQGKVEQVKTDTILGDSCISRR